MLSMEEQNKHLTKKENTAMNDPTRSIEPENAKDLDEPGNLPGIIALLGELKPNAVINEEGIASMFSRHVASVKRAVQRGELPPPTRLFGNNTWTVGTLVRHIEQRLEEAKNKADEVNRKIARLSP